MPAAASSKPAAWPTRNASAITIHAVTPMAWLYLIGCEIEEFDGESRRHARRRRAKPIAEEPHAWPARRRETLAKADATADVTDYALNRWQALTRSSTTPRYPSTISSSRTRSGRCPSEGATGFVRPQQARSPHHEPDAQHHDS